MPENTMRLSDLVPRHAQTLGVDLKAAIYDFRQLMRRITDHYYEASGPIVPADVIWLGGIASDEPSRTRHEIDLGMLNQYFSNWEAALNPRGPDFQCFINGVSEKVPASAIYLSRTGFIAWLEAAAIQPPQCLLPSPETRGTDKSRRGGLDQREMNSVKLLMNTAFELLHIVSQRNSPIRRNAEGLNPYASPGIKAKAFKELANLAGLDLDLDAKTIKKYFPSQDEL